MEMLSNNQNNNAQIQSSCDKVIKILLVDHDMASLVTAADIMNKQCSYKVYTARRADDALCILCADIKFDLVVAELGMPDMDGFTLQELIHIKHQLPVVLISSDKKARDSWKPSENGAVTFLLKPLTYEELIKFSVYVEQWNNRLAKGEFKGSQSSDPKRNKFVWTHDLHSKFVKAIQDIGTGRCNPKKILEIMNEPGLTRVQVNSHLQKFRQWQKKSSGATRTVRPVATTEPVQGFGQSNTVHPTNLKIQPGGGANNIALNPQDLISKEKESAVGGGANKIALNPQDLISKEKEPQIDWIHKEKEKEQEKYLIYTTPAAIEVAGRYAAILEGKGVELTPGTQWVEPVEWWLLPTPNGTTEPPNNSSFGFHQVDASRILKNLAHQYRQSRSGSAGSSSGSTNHPLDIPDSIFVQVVHGAISEARANPGAFLRSLQEWELEGIARNLLENINAESLGKFSSIYFQQVVQVVHTIFMCICNKYEYTTQMAFNEDFHELIHRGRE